MKLNTRPSIYEYEDYRCFLSDMYSHLKAALKPFSFRYFSKHAGFNSPNFLKLVIEGKRNISAESVPRFCKALKLTKQESEFFLHLVQFNQAKNPSEKSDCAYRLLFSRGIRKIHPIKQAEYAYYANWYYIPIRELVGLKEFREDPVWIAKTVFPSITPEQGLQALRDLEALGLLVRDTSGRLQQSQKSLCTENEVSSSAITQYHKEMLSRAAESIDAVPRRRREISAACLPVSAETASKIKTMIQEFQQQILILANEDANPDAIYQINVQLFPISAWSDEEPKS